LASVVIGASVVDVVGGSVVVVVVVVVVVEVLLVVVGTGLGLIRPSRQLCR